MAEQIAATKVTPEMAAIVGQVMRESVSHPVTASDIHDEWLRTTESVYVRY